MNPPSSPASPPDPQPAALPGPRWVLHPPLVAAARRFALAGQLLPLLLNRYLGTDFPRSEDRYFVSPDTRGLLELTEVPNPVGPAAAR